MLKAKDAFCNVPEHILSLADRQLHRITRHPLGIIKRKIEQQFWMLPGTAVHKPRTFTCIDNLPPRVTGYQNFDSLLIPQDHVSRTPHDTYYFDRDHLLRTHTSAHQVDLLRQGHDAFLVTADVYRRDEIDRSHYPVFHQMEGVRVFSDPTLIHHELKVLFNCPSVPALHLTPDNPIQVSHAHRPGDIEALSHHLKLSLETMVRNLFGPHRRNEHEQLEIRWVDAYFPFTSPSWEMEIKFQDQWLEVLGCGVIQHPILSEHAELDESKLGWAFGIGLERIAMVLFGIPDIRLFWSQDPRFLSQFVRGDIVQFKPFSKYPAVYKDVSFWYGEVGFHENDLFELVRSIAGDLVEEIQLIDEFTHPKTGQQSKCYRILYRAMDKTLLNEEVDVLQDQLCKALVENLQVKLR